jgi:rod shape determining protein RodA
LSSIEDTYQKQLVFILLTIPLIFIILGIDCGKFYEKYASIIFVISLLSLAGLFLFGKTIGTKMLVWSWSFTIQPSEFAKAATSLALAKYLSDSQINLKEVNRQIKP